MNEQQPLDRFAEMVLEDHSLHEQLRATPNEAAFIKLAIRLAGERGCVLSVAELSEAISRKRRAWLERWL